LTGSGLSVERRAEVAEELHGHLEQSTAAKCEAGLSRDEAVRAALGDFGETRVIREHLRRQQRASDREAALREVRTHLLGLLCLPAGIGILVFVVSLMNSGISLPLLLAATVTLFGFTGLAMCLVGYGWGLLKRQVRRRLPPREYDIVATFARWFLLGDALLLSSLLVLSVGMLGALWFFMADVAVCGPGVGSRHVLDSIWSMNGDHQLLLVFTIVTSVLAGGFSVVATAYGRLRCTEAETASA